MHLSLLHLLFGLAKVWVMRVSGSDADLQKVARSGDDMVIICNDRSHRVSSQPGSSDFGACP